MNIQEFFKDRSERVENVEIMNTFGNSLNISFTEQDLLEFAQTFNENKSSYRPNLKVDHSTHQSLIKNLLGVETDSELPNLGFFDNLRVVGKSLFADIVEIPKKIKDLLFNGQFKSLSPELYLDYRGTGKKFIESVALTNYPRFKHQLNLSEFENEVLKFSGDINIKGVKNMEDKNITKDDLDVVEKNLLQKFSDFFKKDAPKESEKIEFAEMQNKINQLENVLKEKETELKRFSEAFSVFSAKTRKESVDLLCDKAAARGVPPAIVDQFKPVLLSDIADGKVKFSDKEKTITEIINDFFISQEGKVSFSDRTYSTSEKPESPAHSNMQSEIEENGKKYFSEFKQQGYADHEAWSLTIDKVYEKRGR